MATSLNSLLGGLYTGPSGVSGYSGSGGNSGLSGFSGAGVSGFSGAGVSGFSGLSGLSGFSGGTFNGGTITNPLFVNNATVTTSAGDGALEVVGGVGVGQNIAISGTIVKDFGGGVYTEAIPLAKVRLTGDQTTGQITTATFVSGFTLPLSVVGATYYFQYFLTYAANLTTQGLGTSLSFPAANAFAATQQVVTSQGLTNTQVITGAAKVQAVSVPAANTNYLAVVQGTITTSVSGNLSLAFYTAVAGTTTVLTVKRGSTGWLWRIA